MDSWWRWRDVGLRSCLGLSSGGVLLLLSSHLSLGRVLSQWASTCLVSVTSNRLLVAWGTTSSILMLLLATSDVLLLLFSHIWWLANGIILSLLSLFIDDWPSLESWLGLIYSSIWILSLLLSLFNHSVCTSWLESSSSFKSTTDSWGSLLLESIGGSFYLSTAVGSSLTTSSSSEALNSLLLELIPILRLGWSSCLLNHTVRLSKCCVHRGSNLSDLFLSIKVSSDNIISLDKGI